jgi:hypothetical protein
MFNRSPKSRDRSNALEQEQIRKIVGWWFEQAGGRSKQRPLSSALGLSKKKERKRIETGTTT